MGLGSVVHVEETSLRRTPVRGITVAEVDTRDGLVSIPLNPTGEGRSGSTVLLSLLSRRRKKVSNKTSSQGPDSYDLGHTIVLIVDIFPKTTRYSWFLSFLHERGWEGTFLHPWIHLFRPCLSDTGSRSSVLGHVCSKRKQRSNPVTSVSNSFDDQISVFYSYSFTYLDPTFHKTLLS